MVTEIYNQAVTNILSGIERDIETIVNVTVEDTKTILNERKFRKVVTDYIRDSLIKNIGDITIK